MDGSVRKARSGRIGRDTVVLCGNTTSPPWAASGREGGVNEQTIGSWLEELGSSAPAPGGGAAAALEVAMGAALVEMVCNLTIGKPAFAEHEARDDRGARPVRRAPRRGDRARRRGCGRLHGGDRRLPAAEGDRRRLRGRADPGGARGAADVPRRTAAAASEVLDLAERIVPGREPERRQRRRPRPRARRAARCRPRSSTSTPTAPRSPTPSLRAELDERRGAIERDLARADAVFAAVAGADGRMTLLDGRPLAAAIRGEVPATAAALPSPAGARRPSSPPTTRRRLVRRLDREGGRRRPGSSCGRSGRRPHGRARCRKRLKELSADDAVHAIICLTPLPEGLTLAEAGEHIAPAQGRRRREPGEPRPPRRRASTPSRPRRRRR